MIFIFELMLLVRKCNNHTPFLFGTPDKGEPDGTMSQQHTDDCSQVQHCSSLQCAILSLQPSKCVPALTNSAITSRSTISSRPSNPLSIFLMRLIQSTTVVFTNYIYLPTYWVKFLWTRITQIISEIFFPANLLTSYRKTLPKIT